MLVTFKDHNDKEVKVRPDLVVDLKTWENTKKGQKGVMIYLDKSKDYRSCVFVNDILENVEIKLGIKKPQIGKIYKELAKKV